MVSDSTGLGLGDLVVLCCGGTCILGFIVFALFTGTLGRLFGFGNRMNRPGGTFNNPGVRSGGRIGGSPGFNNPFVGSGGSVGGGAGFDNPDVGSSGSIGGRSSSSETTDRNSSGGGASFG